MLFIIVCSLLTGVVLTLVTQFLLFRRWFRFLPVVTPTWKPQTESYLLPKELLDALKDGNLKAQKESCISLDLVIQFLFQELKDTKRIRRWAMKRMKLEFEEMLRSTTGKLLEHITVRDFNLGRTFPVIRNASVDNVSVNEDNVIEEVTILLDLTYNGRFQLAVDVDMVFGKSAYLSVILTKMQGVARVQFSRQPYTHWSFAFIEDPLLQFEVESQFEGRPIAQLTSVIINQIRKAVRRKHTLPNYKIRYRPFFVMPVSELAPHDIYYQGNKLSIGQLRIVVVGCTRLTNIVSESHIYCALALDSIQWMELMSFRHKLWMAHNVEIMRTAGQNIGLSFGEVFLADKYEEMVVVTAVVLSSPAAKADIQKNDLLVAINGVKVTSSKQAARLMKSSSERINLRMERAIKGFSGSALKPAAPLPSEEDQSSLKAFQATAGNLEQFNDQMFPSNQVGDLDASDDVNSLSLSTELTKPSLERSTEETASIKTADGKLDSSNTQSSSGIPPTSSFASSSPPTTKKGLTQILTSGSGLFQRKKMKLETASSAGELPKVTREPMESRTNDGLGMSQKERKPYSNGGKPPMSSDPAQPVPQKEGLSHRKQEAQAGTPSTVENRIKEPGSQQTSVTNSSAATESGDPAKMRTTRPAKACVNPAFNEKFDFDVEEKHNYLNICVWNKQPEKLDKQSRVIKPEKDVLLGHVSIPLMDIALECLATLQGDVTNVYNLTPSESKVETGRSQFANLASHSGFEERLCHGDVTLRFLYTMESISKKERENICKLREKNELNPEKQMVDSFKDSEEFSSIYSSTSVVLDGQHNFTVAHFQTATYCNFCSKKIWLKTAFQCQSCQMVCHKKCTEKCQAQMKCSKVANRFPKNEQRKEENVISENDVEIVNNVQKQDIQTAEDEELNGEVERKRHNSAPDESLSEAEAKNPSEPALPGTSFPRTRSSTSLIELPTENLMTPTAKCLENAENLSKIFHKVRNSPNSDEMVVTEAKKMGRELYAHLEPEARKEKLDSVIVKLQTEINSERENKCDLVSRQRSSTETKAKMTLQEKIEKSEEKLQSMTVLMLHYCAGLQHCLDQEEVERQKRLALELNKSEILEIKQMKEAEGKQESSKDVVMYGANFASEECRENSGNMNGRTEVIVTEELDKLSAQIGELEETENLTEEFVGAEAEMTMTAAIDNVDTACVNFEPENEAGTPVEPCTDFGIAETINEGAEKQLLTETVGSSTPVDMCWLLGTKEDDTLEEMPDSDLSRASSFAQISMISAFGDAGLQEESGLLTDLPKNEAEFTSDVDKEGFTNCHTNEVDCLPHSSIPNETSVIGSFTTDTVNSEQSFRDPLEDQLDDSGAT